MNVFTWMNVAALLLLTCLLTATEAFTFDGYFKLIALTAKKRDFWRKMFGGNDIGFHIYPYFFEDRSKPPEVPIITSKPGIPTHLEHPLIRKHKDKFHPLLFTPQTGHPMPQSGLSSSQQSFPQSHSSFPQSHSRFTQSHSSFPQSHSAFDSSYTSYNPQRRRGWR